MRMEVTVKVLDRHIQKGKPNKCAECPIALALVDAGFDRPWVDHSLVHYFAKPDGVREELYHFWLPGDAVGFVEDFDEGKPVKPFEFIVDEVARDFKMEA